VRKNDTLLAGSARVLKVQWRFAFAFDPERKAVILCGGAKSGVSQKLFYKQLIDLADKTI